MPEFMWGCITQKPSRANAKKMDRICREEGGWGFDEVNVKEGATPASTTAAIKATSTARTTGRLTTENSPGA